MIRNLAIVVSALAALAAQAQQTQAAAPAESTNTASLPENAERPVLLASRTASLTTASRPPAGAGEKTEANAAKGAATDGATPDCSAVEIYLANGTLAVRSYDEPPASRTSAWKLPPYVASVARCGNLYVLKVRSRSREAWVIRQARLEGPDGTILQVESLRSAPGTDQYQVNVIVAKAPSGTSVPRLRIDMAGEDGRVAQSEVGDLP